MREHGEEFILAASRVLQRFFDAFAIHVVRRLSRQHVHPAQLPLFEATRFRAVRGDHSDQLPLAREQRCRLHRAHTGVEQHCLRQFAGEDVVVCHVLNHDTAMFQHGVPAYRRIVAVEQPEMLDERRLEAAM